MKSGEQVEAMFGSGSSISYYAKDKTGRPIRDYLPTDEMVSIAIHHRSKANGDKPLSSAWTESDTGDWVSGHRLCG